MRINEVTNHPQLSDSERGAIVEETNRILADPSFSGSKRCQALLRSLVDHALAGDHEGVKERSLGVEVFGREADYDTSADPIVRITANEIRKRLGQWYQEPGRHHSIRIRLVPGTYLPKFDFDPQTGTPEITEEKPPETPTLSDDRQRKQKPVVRFKDVLRATLRRGWLLWSAAALVAVIAVGASLRSSFTKTRESRIWEPLLEQHAPLALSLTDEEWLLNGDPSGGDPLDQIAKVIDSREAPQTKNASILAMHTSLIDAFLANKITNRIAPSGKQTTLVRSSELTFEILRHEPVVLIGGFNPWSLILLSSLRYSIRVDPLTHEKWIQDAQNKSSRAWIANTQAERTDVDYAIISRFYDQETGHWILALGGLWPYGTISACSLLTDSEYAHLLPSAFYTRKNTQIVLKTAVINGNPGPPQVIAVYTW